MTNLTSRRYLLMLAFATWLIANSHGSKTTNIFGWFNRAKSCSLAFKTDFPDKEPVLLSPSTSGYRLIIPTNDAVNLKAGEKIALSCPGDKNIIVKLGVNLATAKCVDKQTLNIDGKTYSMNDLGCKHKVTGQVDATTTQCGSRGVIKHIGYNVAHIFLTLFDVCYDDNAGETLYTQHVIHGSSISYTKKGISHPAFKECGLGPGGAANNEYKQRTQETTFASLLGSPNLAEKYIYPNSYLARGHLSPFADFVFASSKCSTSFYINTVPQWQVINGGKWKDLETDVRKLASDLEKEFKVITGGHEVLTLKNTKDEDTKMYLVANNKLPIPKYVWKIVYSLATKKAIAFVSLNNPFVNHDGYLCKDICENYNWRFRYRLKPAKGLVYCCAVEELKKVVKTIPALEITGIQPGPNKK